MHKLLALLLIMLLGPSAFGQLGKVSGILLNSENNKPVANAQVTITQNGSVIRQIATNGSGFFRLEKLPEESLLLIISAENYKGFLKQVTPQQYVKPTVFKLEPLSISLDAVTIENTEGTAGPQRMNSIDGTSIYRGMKSEVISPANITANLSTNNAREAYAAVPGLNIWESDGSGLQLGIGTRGLSPNRTSHLNVRQNLYDISADALGYPESYYSPALDMVDEIQLIRGAAALQYGTQFGGLLNFKMKSVQTNKRISGKVKQTIGTFGLQDTTSGAISSSISYAEVSGKVNRFSYFVAGQYKTGNGWRPNAGYEAYTIFGNLVYEFSEKLSLKVDFTKMNYLAQQPGGLTDVAFDNNPRQSRRERNWFAVDWNLAAIHLDYNINSRSKLTSKTFGLLASRQALGFLGPANRLDPLRQRDLIDGQFQNFGNETRFIHRFQIKEKLAAISVGARIYHGYSEAKQGTANDQRNADFSFVEAEISQFSSYSFPNWNAAGFAQMILPITQKWSITPGIRFEHISTAADGQFDVSIVDGAGNLLEDSTFFEDRSNTRNFVLGGIGSNYKINDNTELYANANQNYRAINFTDMQIRNLGLRIDPNLQDERGYNFDLGFRKQGKHHFSVDLSVFALLYQDKIGAFDTVIDRRIVRYRSNISDARNIGVEAFIQNELLHYILGDSSDLQLITFANFSYINARYYNSNISAFEGNLVEEVPEFNVKIGASIHYKKLRLKLQMGHTSEQFSDATNVGTNPDFPATPNAVNGIISAFTVWDLSANYEWKRFNFSGSINNLTNQFYFTRRAVGYPGPGILPSDGRGYYLGVGMSF